MEVSLDEPPVVGGLRCEPAQNHVAVEPIVIRQEEADLCKRHACLEQPPPVELAGVVRRPPDPGSTDASRRNRHSPAANCRVSSPGRRAPIHTVVHTDEFIARFSLAEHPDPSPPTAEVIALVWPGDEPIDERSDGVGQGTCRRRDHHEVVGRGPWCRLRRMQPTSGYAAASVAMRRSSTAACPSMPLRSRTSPMQSSNRRAWASVIRADWASAQRICFSTVRSAEPAYQ